ETDNIALRKRLLERIRTLKRDRFTTSLVKKVEDRINTYFRKNRYIKAQLLQVKANFDSNRTRAQLHYQIVNPYQFDIYIDNNEHFSDLHLYRTLNLSEVDSRALDPVQDIAEKLKSIYLSA